MTSAFKQFVVAEAELIPNKDDGDTGYNALIGQFNYLIDQIKANIQKIEKNRGNKFNIENGEQTKRDLESQCRELSDIANDLDENQKNQSYSWYTDPRIAQNVIVRDEETDILKRKRNAIQYFDAEAKRIEHVNQFKINITTLKKALDEAPHNQKVIKTKKKLKKLLNNIQEDQHLIQTEKEALELLINTTINLSEANKKISGTTFDKINFYMENGDVANAAIEWEKLNEHNSEEITLQLRNKYNAWLLIQQDPSKIQAANLDKNPNSWELTETLKYKHTNGVIMEKPHHIPYLKGDSVYKKIRDILNSHENWDIKLKSYIETLDSLGTPYIFDPEYNESNYISVIHYLDERVQKPWSDWRQFFDLKISQTQISQTPVTFTWVFTWVRRELTLEERALEKSLSINCLESFLNKNFDINLDLRTKFHDRAPNWKTWRDIFTSGNETSLSESMIKPKETLQELDQKMGSVHIKNKKYKFTDTEAAELILNAIKHFKYTQLQSLFAREVAVVKYLNKTISV
jgi:hypothetical protein